MPALVLPWGHGKAPATLDPAKNLPIVKAKGPKGEFWECSKGHGGNYLNRFHCHQCHSLCKASTYAVVKAHVEKHKDNPYVHNDKGWWQGQGPPGWSASST